ncbi:MAG: UDP-galactopyranose mutase [Clostridiales bacterium]|nr:UDP-galactopyranose mutase [Clostridiales bacterium]
MKYDYLVVGAGLFGAVFAHEMNKKGKKLLVIDKREHIAGNIYTELILDVNVHKYGAHIFHTSDKKVWDYVNQFSEFNHYINSPIARYHDELYNMPFNMNTFNKMWGVITPTQAREKIEEQIKSLNIDEPKNLEEQALSLVGYDVYEKLVKGYTEKQWGRDCKELPAFIIKRLPLRFTYDNNYFNDVYQGIPIHGYTYIVEKMLEGIEVKTATSYQEYIKTAPKDSNGSFTDGLGNTFSKILYTGMIDEYFGYKLGHLEYRSLRFEQEEMPECDNFQGNAVVNYTDRETPYTRIIEHKHFEFGKQPGTVITKEYPMEWKVGEEPYYPVNNERNNSLYAEYRKLAEEERNVLFGGRLGWYQYYDMDKIVAIALQMAEKETAGEF